jgi:hypothetical protein
MKKSQKNMVKISASIVSLGILLFGYNQCIIDNKTNAPRRTTAGEQSNPQSLTPDEPGYSHDYDFDQDPDYVNEDNPLPDPVPPIMEAETLRNERIDHGIKNFEQINMTMSYVTGVPSTEAAVRNVYNEVVAQLPTDNELKSFAPSNQVGITKLAIEYCDRAVENASLREQIWPGIRFQDNLNAVMTPANQSLIVSQTMNRFIGQAVLPQDVELAMDLELRDLVPFLMNGEQNNNTSTRRVVKGVCTAVLASLPLYLL